jgi:hypothetical protein
MNPLTTTPQAMYEELVAAIVKAVPEIDVRKCAFCDRVLKQDGFCDACGSPKTKHFRFRPITLEDVLLWVGTLNLAKHFIVLPSGNMYLWDGLGMLSTDPNKFHLNKTLEWHRDNSPETIAFLHSILPSSSDE